MSRIVAVTHHPSGRRLYVLGRRLHHGDWGLLAVLGGALWCWRDRRDASQWLHFRRELTR